MKRAMLENEHSKFNTYVFILYVRLRSLMRNILNLVNPDLKSKIISKLKKMEMKKESQVPKIIHLMWFSGDEYPDDIKICLDTWHKVLPEYEIKVWTKEMALECDLPYVKEALLCRKWLLLQM